MKAFLAFGWKPEWDVQSIKDVGWLCDGRTTFRGVSKILPGHYIVCRSFETIAQYKYWDLQFKDKVSKTGLKEAPVTASSARSRNTE